MKYEMIFGDQSLFDNASDGAVLAIKDTTSGRIHFFTNEGWIKSGLKHERHIGTSDNEIAMRRIISEPKRWTVEDQKAGLLPDVGCEYIGRDVLLTCVLVDKNRDVWGKSKDNLMHCHNYLGIIPIESPEEKAERLRSEWINKAYVDFHRLGCELEVLQKEQIKQIYDALLSGELTMPGKVDE